MPVDPLSVFADKPTIAQHSIHLDKGVSIHYRHDLPGELDASKQFSHHLLTFFMSENERQITRIDGFGEFDGQMRRGDFYLYPAGISGLTRWQSSDKTVHVVIRPGFLNELATDIKFIGSGSVELLPTLKSRDRNLSHLMQLLFSEMTRGNVGGRLYFESLSNALGVHLLRHYCNVTPETRRFSAGLAPSKLNIVIDYIQEQLDGDLSLDLMAAQVGVSRCYFATQFRQTVGLTPHQYVTQQRLDKAKQLLKLEKHAIADIALACGFSNQSHFTRVFKQCVGITPKAYREQR
ncbi:MAG: AraC family transcriptional regulator [Cyanobacteria bacterium P01_D01_bin.128]